LGKGPSLVENNPVGDKKTQEQEGGKKGEDKEKNAERKSNPHPKKISVKNRSRRG